MNFLHILNPEIILKSVGVAGLLAIVFAESGLLIGFFFPGDSLLFTAGFLAPFLGINVFVLALEVAVMAILGDSVGYYFGKRIGPTLFKKEASLFFNKNNIARAEKFFHAHGPKAILLARFVPVVRTLVPVIAGVGKMRYITFIGYNILGGILWGAGLTLLGSYLGSVIPNIDHYILPIVLVIIVISLLPIGIGYMRHKGDK